MSDIVKRADDAISTIETGLADKHEVMQALAFVQKLGEVARALRYRFDQAAIAYIEQHGELEEGEKRWYVGTVTKRTCTNPKEAIQTILETEGIDGLVAALSTSCFRPATAMEMLGERAAELFAVDVVKDLKTGKPRKALKGVPLAFGRVQTEEDE